MAATTTPLLTALLKKTVLDDHDELLKASNAALKKSKSDSEAQRIKTIALVKLDRYEEAVKFVQDCGRSLQEIVALEYAYALYKVGRLEEAADVAKSTKSRGRLHLEAQARYRLEDSQTTARIYEDILKDKDTTEAFDLRVNQSAVTAQSQWLGTTDSSTAKRPGREELANFETAYNAACGSIARGELAQSEILLKRAKELCKHNEELSEEQKTEELLPITVQQLYVLHALGKSPEADSLAEEISVESISDPSTRAVAQSNKLMTSTTPNPFLAHKAFNSTPKPPPSDKLFSYQSIPFSSNKRTIDVQALKFDGMKSPSLSKDQSPTSPEVLLTSVFSAAAHARNEVSKAAIKKVLPELSKRPNDIGLITTIVQMYVLTGNESAAIELMESLFKRLDNSSSENERELRYTPGLVSIIVSLYRRQSRRVSIKQELAKAASYWKHKPRAPPALLRAAGSALLESADAEDTQAAAEIFKKLRQQQPAEQAAIAGYVASHASSDSKDVSAEVDKLTSVADLTSKIDVDTLENAGIPQSSNAMHIAQLNKSRKRATAADDGPSRPKRVRKSRLPKDHDPEKKPDPERWLPMKDRSYYRAPKSKRKGKKGGDGGTQGGAVNESLNIDAKPAASGQAGGGGGGKKKGKKR